MFEQAKWIANPKVDTASPLFRHDFTVKEGLSSATLSFVGLGYGIAFLNGRPVTEDVLTTPLTKFDSTVLYNAYNVKKLLKTGKNAIGCMLGNGWYNDIAAVWDFEKASWRHHPKMILQLDLAYEDGTSERICSNSKWETGEGPAIFNHVRSGECWDARLEQPGWNEVGFSGVWANAFVCRSPGGLLKLAEHPPIRIIKTLPAKEIYPGIYDVGQNISGWARIRVKGNPGDTADLYYSERITPDGQLDVEQITSFCPDKEFAHHDRYILKGSGTEEWEPHFCYHGFRYIRVESSAEIQLEGRVVHTNLPVIGEFSCSDEMINRIHSAARWSTLGNYHGVPTDCPHREQNGWTGDALLSSEQALMNYDMVSAYRKWLRDFQDVQRPSGQLPGIVPTSGWGFNWGSGPAWDSALILIPYYIWKYADDSSVMKEFWPNMERYISYMDSMAEDGLVDYGLGDWLPPDDAAICPSMLTDTAYYYRNCCSMAEMAKKLGRDSAPYTKRAEYIRAAFRNRFVENGKILPESQTAYACAIYQGLLNKDELPGAAARLAELVREKEYHIDCGILGTKYIFTALSDYGYGDVLYRMITNPTCPSYAWWMNQGMTTLCEDWEMRNSLNHHMSSEVDLWFYRYLAGIRLEEGTLTVAPLFLPELKWVKASHAGIQVSWDENSIEIITPTGGTLILNGETILLNPGANRFSRK